MGVVEVVDRESGVREKRQYEIDFVVNRGARKYYIQSALNVSDLEAESRPLRRTNDFFKKIIVTKSSAKPWTDEYGIVHLGLYDFLLDSQSLDLI